MSLWRSDADKPAPTTRCSRWRRAAATTPAVMGHLPVTTRAHSPRSSTVTVVIIHERLGHTLSRYDNSVVELPRDGTGCRCTRVQIGDLQCSSNQVSTLHQ